MMNAKKTVLAAAVGGLMTLGAVQAVFAADEGTEKCYGIAKAGKNDCAGAAHSCAGQGKADKAATEWVKLPKGTCERIVGGSLSGPSGMRKK
jgi:uncharacterized membrane protein